MSNTGVPAFVGSQRTLRCEYRRHRCLRDSMSFALPRPLPVAPRGNISAPQAHRPHLSLGLRQSNASLPPMTDWNASRPCRFFWAEQFGKVAIDAKLDERDCTITYWRSGGRLAVAVVHRHLQGLRAEVEFERISAAKQRPIVHAKKRKRKGLALLIVRRRRTIPKLWTKLQLKATHYGAPFQSRRSRDLELRGRACQRHDPQGAHKKRRLQRIYAPREPGGTAV